MQDRNSHTAVWVYIWMPHVGGDLTDGGLFGYFGGKLIIALKITALIKRVRESEDRECLSTETGTEACVCLVETCSEYVIGQDRTRQRIIYPMVGANVSGWISGPVSVASTGDVYMKATSHGSSDSLLGLTAVAWMRSPRRWIVQTESNVKRQKRKIPDPPCVICKGTCRVECNRCRGRGRTNFTEEVMLPKGEWPKWCWDCSGCGMSYCTRCFGTGEKRGIIGFHLPEENDSSKT